MSPTAPGFGALKARQLFALLERELGYTVVRGSIRKGGSHRKLTAPNRPPLVLAFHDNVEVGPAMVRDILVKQCKLTREEAKEVFRRA